MYMSSIEKSSKVTEYVPGRIVQVQDVLTPQECEKLIMDAEKGGFQPSPLSGGGHGQTPRTGARTSQF